MHYDRDNSDLYLTRPERHLLGRGQDRAYPLREVDNLLQEALDARAELVNANGPEEDIEVVENLICQLGDLQEEMDETRDSLMPNCTVARFVGCAALSDNPFKKRVATMRRYKDAYQGYF